MVVSRYVCAVIVVISAGVFAHHCSKEDCPDLPSVLRGPLEDKGILGKRRFILAYVNTQSNSSEAKKIGCVEEVVSSNEAIGGYTATKVYRNLTTHEIVKKNEYFKVNPNNPAEYINLDDSGNSIPNGEYRVIYNEEGYLVLYGCPHRNEDQSRCKYCWRLCGPNKHISDVRYREILYSLASLGLTTDIAHRVNHESEQCKVPESYSMWQVGDDE